MPITSSPRTTRVYLLLVCFLLICTCLSAPVMVAHAADATLTLTPTSGMPLSSVQATGSGFGANEQVTITFNKTQVQTTTTTSSGSFATTFTVPKSAHGGTHTVTATGQSSDRTASVPFQVLNVSWPFFSFDASGNQYNPDENIINTSNVSSLTTAWTFTGFFHHTKITPTVVNGVMYATDGLGLYAINAATGAKLWSITPLQNGQTPASPAVANNVVYLGFDTSTNNTFYAINAATGTQVWSYTTDRGSSVSSSSAVVVTGVVYFSTNGGFGSSPQVYALNAVTGAKLWSFKPSYSLTNAPMVANGVVYIGAYNNTFYALNAATGAVLWSTQLPYIVSTSATVANGVVYVGTDDGDISNSYYALNAATGAILWSFTVNLGRAVRTPHRRSLMESSISMRVRRSMRSMPPSMSNCGALPLLLGAAPPLPHRQSPMEWSTIVAILLRSMPSTPRMGPNCGPLQGGDLELRHLSSSTVWSTYPNIFPQQSMPSI